MIITEAELRSDPDKYLSLAAKEDICIIGQGKLIAMLTNPSTNRTEIVSSLFGVLPQTMTMEEVRASRSSDGGESQ